MQTYLQVGDGATYGIPNVTSAQLQQASAQIDAYLGRREGLVWVPDGNGAPAYMGRALPELTLTLNGAINPGTNVTAILIGPTQMIQAGAVLIADSGTPSITEALVVQSVTGQSVVFNAVQFAHANGATLQTGLTIVEQRTMPQNRPLTMVSRTPVTRVLSGVGRYGYMRRGEDSVGSIDTYNLLAVMSKFGGPPAWEPWTPQANSIDPQTGQIWVPAGVLLAYYTEVRIHYVAGWAYASIPQEIRQACANIANNIINTAGVPGTMQKVAAGDTSFQRFNVQPQKLNSLLIDDDTKALLEPYRVRIFA